VPHSSAAAAAGKGADDDVEAGMDEFPMVLVQIPMCNEKEVSKFPLRFLISCACNAAWDWASSAQSANALAVPEIERFGFELQFGDLSTGG
jgi:hypothetical protein